MNSNKDNINVHPSTISHGGINHGGNESNGKGYVVREWAKNMQIDDFNPEQGDMLVFDDSLGITSEGELANLITNTHIEANNFIVNFGNNVTITLTDVQPDQIDWDNVVVGDLVKYFVTTQLSDLFQFCHISFKLDWAFIIQIRM